MLRLWPERWCWRWSCSWYRVAGRRTELPPGARKEFLEKRFKCFCRHLWVYCCLGVLWCEPG